VVIDFGKWWIVGGWLYNFLNVFGLVVVIVVGFSVFSWLSIFYLLWNVCFMLYCWLSIMLMMSVNGCLLSMWFVFGLFVIWKFMCVCCYVWEVVSEWLGVCLLV